jgi:tRNA modification GTPase
MYYGHIVDKKGNIIDEATMVRMPEGRSYTGQRQAEIFCHGGQYALKLILELIFDCGARPAEPGEFTRRAFLAGRIDLAEAEAVADLIASKTEHAYATAKNNLLGIFSEQIEKIRNKLLDALSEIEASIDYPEEEIEAGKSQDLLSSLTEIQNDIMRLTATYKSGKIIREGLKIAIAGRPNVGKSSLFNLLLNQNRAIVTPTPGTTRDYLTEWIDIDGTAVSITDTAGLRKGRGIVEKAGQKLARNIIKSAGLVIWVVDISRRNWKKELSVDLGNINNTNILLLFNKIDCFENHDVRIIEENNRNLEPILLSCLTRQGWEKFRKALTARISNHIPDLTDGLIVTSERHKKKLSAAIKHIKNGIKHIKNGDSPEIISFELRLGIAEVDEITGRIYNEEVLDRIFSKFCIGK